MGWNICLTFSRIHFIDEKDSDSHDQNENTIASYDNIEKHSSDECNGEESSEEDESSDDDWSFGNEKLGNHMVSHSYTNKGHRLHDQGQYKHLYTWLHFNNAL